MPKNKDEASPRRKLISSTRRLLDLLKNHKADLRARKQRLEEFEEKMKALEKGQPIGAEGEEAHSLLTIIPSDTGKTATDDHPGLEPADRQESVTLERAFSSITTFQQTASAKRNSRLAMRYFGLDGRGGCTLQEVGGEFGVTRERARQVSTRIARKLQESNWGFAKLVSS